jgi:hypothetical protein
MATEQVPDSERRYPPRAIAEAWKVNRWIGEGLPAFNVGSSQRPDWRIRLSDVEAFLAERGRQRPADGVDSSDG